MTLLPPSVKGASTELRSTEPPESSYWRGDPGLVLLSELIYSSWALFVVGVLLLFKPAWVGCLSVRTESLG